VRRAARLGAVAAVLSGVVLALLGLPHLFRAAPLRLVVSPGDSAGLPSIGDGRFTVAIAALAGVGLEPSPTGQVLTDGDGTFPVLYEDLRSARRSITMQVYYKSGGVVADSVRRILVERARAGVSVHFMHDAFGSEALPTHYGDTLRAAGVRVATFRPFRWYELDRVGHRSHTRAIVIDGRVGYTGGYGLDDKWLGSGRRPGEWRETSIRFTGHAVSQLQAAFVEEWAEATGELLTGSLLFPETDAPPAEAGAGVPALAGVVHSKSRPPERRRPSGCSRYPSSERAAPSSSATPTSSRTRAFGGCWRMRRAAAWTSACSRMAAKSISGWRAWPAALATRSCSRRAFGSSSTSPA